MHKRTGETWGEPVLYGLAAVVYVALGVRFGGLVLNWIVGPTFPFLVVYLLPRWVRRPWRTRDVVDLREPERDPERDHDRVTV